MTTLTTGLPINSRTADAKFTPALRLAVQKATSVFQKDFCYDFLQALVDEPEVADPIGVRLFLNFCLRKPDNLVDSFLDSLDQNLGPAESFSETADTILDEIENFIEFVHGLIEMIDGGEIFKLAYHEIDAWKLCYQLLEPVQHRLFDLAVQDRSHLSNHLNNRESNNSVSSEPYELTFASDSTSSGFYQAFVTIDKFLKHSFESRILLEPAKLVEDAEQLSARRTELRTFRALFPSTQNATLLMKKHGRFGREEATIDSFLESDKFKELSKLKATMSGGQLTRQPSTRTKKATSKLEPPDTGASIGPGSKTNKHSHSRASPSQAPDSTHKSKRAISRDSPPALKEDIESTRHLDPFLREDPPSLSSNNGKPAFSRKRIDESESDPDFEDTLDYKKRAALATGKPTSRADSTESTRRQGSALPSHGSTTSSVHPKRKRQSRVGMAGAVAGGGGQMDGASSVAPKGRKKRKSKTAKSANGDHEDGKAAGQDEELFVVDKIIAESVDVNGETIYKVLWAGYPESEATWQFANTLDDCAALDVWQQAKLETRAAAAEVEELQESLTRAITNASTRPDADGFATAGADPARLNGGTPAVFAQSQAITDSFRDHAV
ncbi:hypothetical protein PCANC_05374 [Puccinia coronata f. sp. avenae]|uniref:Chromo domain-containing protein n=1 Tax=Puccinia coronata f. sp. avenae TaxID=200324 RepID=A0A2N5VXD6_9BASI|nr:hypothetical protein PCASD_08280 [Puccinia coronata f. sp. avenae]PLW54645.1 hypothetical protein PCANC_05374 [Puccinia coronata f. sp. avenae]